MKKCAYTHYHNNGFMATVDFGPKYIYFSSSHLSDTTQERWKYTRVGWTKQPWLQTRSLEAEYIPNDVGGPKQHSNLYATDDIRNHQLVQVPRQAHWYHPQHTNHHWHNLRLDPVDFPDFKYIYIYIYIYTYTYIYSSTYCFIWDKLWTSFCKVCGKKLTVW